MRLINTTTLKLEEYVDPKPYAILSHTWHDGDEVLHAEYVAQQGHDKKGYKKIKYLCAQARKEGLQYAWIDTVCIDKSSSAELSEAINSMFKWYERACTCYVYLDDTEDVAGIESCRWLTRGWTLQELLAPYRVRFYNKDWIYLGTKTSLVSQLVKWTGIDQMVLEDRYKIWYTSVATRMYWAGSRNTTRVEDMAYCLLGIFDLNLPLMYGEGKKAFRRLQEEILRRDCDLSLLAFERGRPPEVNVGGIPHIFAHSPAAFRCGYKVLNVQSPPHKCKITNKGLKISLSIMRNDDHDNQNGRHYWAILPCRREFDQTGLIALPIHGYSDGCLEEGQQVAQPVVVFLDQVDQLTIVPYDQMKQPWTVSLMLFDHYARRPQYTASRQICCFKADTLTSHGFEVIYADPDNNIGSWDPSNLVSEVASYRKEVVIRKFGFLHRLHREAFILMFTVVAHEFVGTPQVFFCAKVKPEDMDGITWFEKEGMYSVVKQPAYSDQTWFEIQEATAVVDNELWECVHDSQAETVAKISLYERLPLSSNKCFSEVKLSLDHFSSGSHIYRPDRWTITIEHGDHPDEVEEEVIPVVEPVTKAPTPKKGKKRKRRKRW